MRELRKVALIGLGAIGSYFAPALASTLGDGFRVIADGERAKRLSVQGVSINGTTWRFPIVSPDDAKGFSPADLVICAVKSYSLPQALEDMRPFVGPDTLILTVQNGVDSEQQAIEVYSEERVLYSIMRASVNMKDGVATFDPAFGAGIIFGDKVNTPPYSERVQAISGLFGRCGIRNQVGPDMERVIWYKYMCNISENMTCALLGVPFGAFRSSADADWFRKGAMREVIAIAQAKGIDLGEDDIAAQEPAMMTGIPVAAKPSTLQDLEAGKHTELDIFSGALCRMGDELGIDTPINDVFYHGIRVLEAKGDGSIEGMD